MATETMQPCWLCGSQAKLVFKAKGPVGAVLYRGACADGCQRQPTLAWQSSEVAARREWAKGFRRNLVTAQRLTSSEEQRLNAAKDAYDVGVAK